MACGRRVGGTISSLINARDLQIGCARVLHETLLVPVLTYGSETMICKEERSRIRAVQMDNLKDLLGVRRMDSPECMDNGVVGIDGGGRRKD